MAAATIEASRTAARPEVAPPAARHRRGAVTATCIVGAVVALLFGLGTAQTDGASTSARSWGASSERLGAEAEAYVAEQVDIARGLAADSARLQAAADRAR